MNKNIPQRRCVGCYKSYNKSSLFRVVRTPDGNILQDDTGTMDGRGAYVCKNRQCLTKVQKSNGIGRALKCEIPTEVFELLERQVTDDE